MSRWLALLSALFLGSSGLQAFATPTHVLATLALARQGGGGHGVPISTDDGSRSGEAYPGEGYWSTGGSPMVRSTVNSLTGNHTIVAPIVS